MQVPRESPFPEVHSVLTRVPAISGKRQDAPPRIHKSGRCVVSCIDCRWPSAALCLREFSTAQRRRRVTERGGNPFYIVVDAEEYTTNRDEDFMEQAEAGDFFTRLTGEEAHSRLSSAFRNPLLSANQHVAMHSHTFAKERTVYAYPRQVIKCCGMHQDETRREGGKVNRNSGEKMESEQSPSIGKDGCPIIETTRHRSMENGKNGIYTRKLRFSLCHRVTQNAESSECGPATVDTPGYVDIRTSRAKVDERHGD
ncbi:hypothetical protein ALC60_04366 [Trachymyrmex zeteki]|uniref:Uncharacterized protein n=1 Tax=Mycetomoellerius zeteki TaxID=64791 RepID=A0A151X8R4_9HYME|nr:hypothetical protein ALC60_04366 [Trachymyrmex zeteki]